MIKNLNRKFVAVKVAIKVEKSIIMMRFAK